jgi:hypothetical protein
LFGEARIEWPEPGCLFVTILSEPFEQQPRRPLFVPGSAVARGADQSRSLPHCVCATPRLVYYAFDLLHLDGFDTRAAPLIERKRVLRSFLTEAASSAPGVIYSEHFDDGADLYRRAFRMGLEGIVSKRADAPYRSGRTETWVKVKCWKRDRFVVVGFVPDGAGGLAKLRFARREGRALVYAGRVGNRMGPQNRSRGSGSTRAARAAHVAALQADQEKGHDVGRAAL